MAAANRLHLPFAIALAAAAAAGCARDTSDLDAYIGRVKSQPPAPIEPIPEMRPFVTFAYPEGGLRDPFAPIEADAPLAAQGGPRPDETRPRELLEDFALDGLRMMGTLQQKGDLWALVRDPTGTIHRVQTGNYLGQNHGRIVTISEQQVKLVELVADSAGIWIQREAALAVKE